jgi:hypothetical protein
MDRKSKIAYGCKLEGIYRMYSIKDQIKKQVGEEHNVIMDDCLNQVGKAFIGDSLFSEYGFGYLAIGDDNTSPTASDVILGNELFRTPYVAIANPSSKVVTADFYITDTDFSGDIEEMGLFGGGTVESATDSGNLISRVLWEYTKSSSEELVIEYELTIS